MGFSAFQSAFPQCLPSLIKKEEKKWQLLGTVQKESLKHICSSMY
jgi:hypothetical protein